MGRQSWNTPTNNQIIIETIKKFYPELLINGDEPLENIIEKYPKESFIVIKEAFIDAVKDEKVTSVRNKVEKEQIFEEAIRIYYSENPDTQTYFEMLPNEEKEKYFAKVSISPIVSDSAKNAALEEAIRVAEKTIERIFNLETKGQLKNHSAAWVLLNITSNISQFDYLSDELINQWREEYGITSDVPDNEMIEVYIFQSSDDRNFLTYNGNIGPKDSQLFAISSKSYEELLSDRTLFDENKKCIDIERLSAILGNVILGENPMAICLKVKKSDILCSTGNLSTAYFGEFGPPLSTQGGFYKKDGVWKFEPGKPEATVPSTQYTIGNKRNPNVRIISHGPKKTTEEIVAKADKLFGISEELVTGIVEPKIFEDPELLYNEEIETTISQTGSENSVTEEAALPALEEAITEEEAIIINNCKIIKNTPTETNGVRHGL